MPTRSGENMDKKITGIVTLIACLGCGGKQSLEDEVSSLKQDVRDCEYAIKDQKLKQRELRMEALPKEAKRPPAPPYVGPWRRTFSALVLRVREAMGDREHHVGFKNGTLVISIPSSTFFAEGAKRITGNGRETLDALVAILNEAQHRDLGVTVRSAELSRQGIGKRGSMDAEGSRRFNRALSISRAMEIANAIEDAGIDPMNIVPAAYAVNPDEENPAEDGTVEISLHPIGDEIPDFPEPKGTVTSKKASRSEPDDDPDIEELD